VTKKKATKRAKRSKRSTKSKKSATASPELLDAGQKREIFAYVLVALAILLALSLVPVSWLGERGIEWFPSGNLIGIVGATISTLLSTGVGLASLLLPVLLLSLGLDRGGWVPRQPSLRTAALSGGLLLLLPIALQVVSPLSSMGGAWGRWIAEPMSTAFGWIGALVICGVALMALIVATLRVSPVKPLGRALAQTGTAIGRTASAARESLRVAPEADETTSTPPPIEALGDPEPPPSETSRVTPEPEPVPEPEPDTSSATDVAVVADDPSESSTGDEAEPAVVLDGQEVGEPAPLPELDLLYEPPAEERRGMEEELDRLGQVLVEKLQSFNVDCSLGGRTTGPVVTQFEIVPASGVKVNKIANLDADLALAMKAKSIRIVAPIPGKGAVGGEIPNPKAVTVPLREVLQSKAFQDGRATLPLALGRDLNGRAYVADLAKMPHVLIAGATGSGKSVCLNTIITSLVYRHTPETLRLLLIDPKMVELSTYGHLPHLRHSVVTDPKDAAAVLKWAVLEMERRYALLSVNGVRSIAEFNKRVESGTVLRRKKADGVEGDPDRWIYTDGVLPFVVVVVDELADLMMSVQGEVEKPLTQLAQKARAIGIHLIVATQRPSVNVITGLIKANFPTRIAFRVASKTDSRTILDQNGADALLGNGDMLFLPPGQSEPVRMQGAFISTEETDHLMSWFKQRIEEKRARLAEVSEDEGDILELVRANETEETEQTSFAGTAPANDELFRAAAEICIQQEGGSTSLLQRKLRIGYGRAARIVDQLHEAGILGPPDGSKPREVLIGFDGLELLMSGLDGTTDPPPDA